MWLNSAIPASSHSPRPAALARLIASRRAADTSTGARLVRRHHEPRPDPRGELSSPAAPGAPGALLACSGTAPGSPGSGSPGSPSSRSKRPGGPRTPSSRAGMPRISPIRISIPSRWPDSGPIRASRRVADGGTIGMWSRSDCVAVG